jgi:hypothetical protein
MIPADRMPHWITPTRSWASEAKEVRNRNRPLRSLSTSDLSIVEIDSSFSEFGQSNGIDKGHEERKGKRVHRTSENHLILLRKEGEDDGDGVAGPGISSRQRDIKFHRPSIDFEVEDEDEFLPMPLHSNRRNRPLRIYDMSATHPTAFNAGINLIRGLTIPTPEAIGTATDDTESSRDLKDEKASTFRFRLRRRSPAVYSRNPSAGTLIVNVPSLLRIIHLKYSSAKMII